MKINYKLVAIAIAFLFGLYFCLRSLSVIAFIGPLVEPRERTPILRSPDEPPHPIFSDIVDPHPRFLPVSQPPGGTVPGDLRVHGLQPGWPD